jgi:hypothetical protein
MAAPVVLDGRNCLSRAVREDPDIAYEGVGRA